MPGIVPKGQTRQRHGHTTESRGGQIEGTTLFSKKKCTGVVIRNQA
jgi:hypothetical protein